MGDHGVVKCFIDIVMDIQGPIPKGIIKESFLAKSSPVDLPHPFELRKEPGQSKIDLAIIPQNDGLFCACKIVNLKSKEKVPYARSMCFGTPYMIDWSGEVRTVKSVCAISLKTWVASIVATMCSGRMKMVSLRKKSQEEWDFGFDFIEEHGPRDNTKNRMLRWVTIEINKPGSPIYQWHSVLVEKSLRNLIADGVLAQVHEHWPLTLYDLDVRFLKALAPLMPTLQEKALGFHGEPGAGKTPVARIITMAMSQHWIRKAHKESEITPSFQQASEFDFFRGQSGSIFRPDIFDDGAFCEQQLKKIKAFTDVGNVKVCRRNAGVLQNGSRANCESTTWTTSTQSRSLPVLVKKAGHHSYVSHDSFMKMLDIAWFAKEANPSNIMAVLKRTHLCINTKTFLYIRPASESPRPVMRLPLDDKTDLLHSESRTLYDFYRKGGADLPRDFQQKVDWEMKWLNMAMAGRPNDVPVRTTILGRSLFGDSHVAAPCSTMTKKRPLRCSRRLPAPLTSQTPRCDLPLHRNLLH